MTLTLTFDIETGYQFRATRSSDGARCLKVRGYRKNWTYRRHFTSAIRASLTENQGPSLPVEKNDFVIGEDAISRCLERLTYTL